MRYGRQHGDRAHLWQYGAVGSLALLCLVLLFLAMRGNGSSAIVPQPAATTVLAGAATEVSAPAIVAGSSSASGTLSGPASGSADASAALPPSTAMAVATAATAATAMPGFSDLGVPTAIPGHPTPRNQFDQ
jgi:hypothetical protein